MGPAPWSKHISWRGVVVVCGERLPWNYKLALWKNILHRRMQSSLSSFPPAVIITGQGGGVKVGVACEWRDLGQYHLARRDLSGGGLLGPLPCPLLSFPEQVGSPCWPGGGGVHECPAAGRPGAAWRRRRASKCLFGLIGRLLRCTRPSERRSPEPLK